MGGSSSSTTKQFQQQTSYPQWTQDAQTDTYQTGTAMLENFLRNPQYNVAGFTTDALKGFDLARDTARGAYTAPQITVPGADGNQNLMPAMVSGAQSGAATMPASSMLSASMSPSTMRQAFMPGAKAASVQLGAGEAQEFMNPYMQNVLDPTIANMRRDRDASAARIGAKYAAQGGLGGSGEAIARGQLDRSHGEQVAQTAATLMAQGYSQAQSMAMANAQMRQQTELTNAGFTQDASKTNATLAQDAYKTNATLAQDASRTNAGFLQDASKTNATLAQDAGRTNASFLQDVYKTNAGFDQQARLSNQAADNAMRALGLDYGLKGAQVQDQLRTSQQAREMSILQQILQNSDAQRGVAQQALDVPWTMLGRLAGLTPQQMNSMTSGTESSQTKQSQSPLSMLSSLAGSLFGGKGIIGGLGIGG